MPSVRTLIACLSLIIAGILFSTGTAYAAGGESKGGNTVCSSQIGPYGNPIIRCVDSGNNKDENGGAPGGKHHWHHHYHHRWFHAWCHHHFRHYFHHSCHHHR